jgi:hypothetical protein
MKIVSIFANQLFAFHYENEKLNELRRLLKLWNNTEYLFKFVTSNKLDAPQNIPIYNLISQLINNANQIDVTLDKISKDPNRALEEFFKPLENQEYQIVELSKQKGRNNYLRLFAIKIDNNCFVITGGAIKFHHRNKDRLHTQTEMDKLDNCKNYLKNNGVFDSDSLNDFLIE